MMFRLSVLVFLIITAMGTPKKRKTEDQEHGPEQKQEQEQEKEQEVEEEDVPEEYAKKKYQRGDEAPVARPGVKQRPTQKCVF